MLKGFDPRDINNTEGARKAIVRLLNLIEELKTENIDLREENQQLKDEINRLKGEQGKPNIKGRKRGRKKPGNYSSEKERHRGKKREKQSKKDQLKIDRLETLRVDPNLLPADAEFKGYEQVPVQDIKITTDNVMFYKEKWYSRSEGKSYLARLPVGYEGEFGPAIKAWTPVFGFGINTSEQKIADFYETVGIKVSIGQISKWLIKDHQELDEEKEGIYEAGLSSTSWQQTDHTNTKVNGENWHTQIMANPLYTAYFTKEHKDRLTVIRVLWGDRELKYKMNETAFKYLEEVKMSERKVRELKQIKAGVVYNQAEFESQLKEIKLGKQQYRWVLEAGALGAYHSQTEFPIIKLLLADDARQFKRITKGLALCWIHEGRHYKKLNPQVEYHGQLQEEFLKEFWGLYDQILNYCTRATPEEQQRLESKFDQLFSKQTGYGKLDQQIAKSKGKRRELLEILKHPEIPAHNNGSELAARQLKPKQNVSYGPRVSDGVKAWDTYATLIATAKKLGVNIYAYLYDRISKSYQMPSLVSIIEQKALIYQKNNPWDDRLP